MSRRRSKTQNRYDNAALIAETMESRLLLTANFIFDNIDPNVPLTPGETTFLLSAPRDDRFDVEFYRINGDQQTLYSQTNSFNGSVTVNFTAGEYLARLRNTAGGEWQEMCFAVAPQRNPIITGPTSPDFISMPTLTWQAVTGASHYEVEVFDSTNDVQVTTFDNITTTGFQIPSSVTFSGGTEYRFSVRAHFDSDPATSWSSIVLENILGDERAPLSVNVSAQETQTPSIGWFSPSISRVAADHHNLSINVVGDSANLIYARALAATGAEVTGTFHTTEQFLPAGEYEVWVQTTYVDGTQSRLGTPVTFTITDQTVIQSPTLNLAVYDSLLVRPEFQWTTQGNDISYELWVSPQSDTGNPVIHLTGYVSSMYTPTTDMAPGIYNAWVRATRTGNLKSNWSTATTFAVHPRGAEPVVVTGGTGQQTDTTPLIQWEAVDNVQDGYELFISEVGSSSVAVYNRKGLTGTSHELETPLEAGKSYNVWVRADYDIRYISAGTSRWGDPYLLTIPGGSAGEPTDPITFTSGTGSSTDTTPELQWEARSNVNRYDLFINVVGDRSSATYRQSSLTGTSHVVEAALANDTRYEVWIRAYYTDGTSTRWGTPSILEIGTVGTGFSDTPIAVTSGVGTIAESTPTLTWEDRSGVTLYDVYINEVGNRGTAVYRNANVSSNSLTLETALGVDSQYEVWVRALYSDGTRTRWGTPAALNIVSSAVDFEQIMPVVAFVGGNTASWQPVSGAATYELWINQYSDTGQLLQARILHRTDLTATSLDMSLATGNYRGWLRAVAGNDQRTAWSSPVAFTVATAEPATNGEDLNLLKALQPGDAVNYIVQNSANERTSEEAQRDYRPTVDSNTMVAKLTNDETSEVMTEIANHGLPLTRDFLNNA